MEDRPPPLGGRPERLPVFSAETAIAALQMHMQSGAVEDEHTEQREH